MSVQHEGIHLVGSIRRVYDRVLEAIAVVLIVAVTIIVVLGFTFRWMGLALVWYDEVASISLAWLTYFGAALAALRGSHLGFAGFVNSLPANWRVLATLCASGITIFFFGLLAVTGYQVVQAISGLTLVSLPAVQQQWVASVIPIASVLFVIAELIRLPDSLAEARQGPLLDPEIKEALEEHGAIEARRQEPAR
jgi:TRAP-type C4-dicarboxylate transport system permease small subunit